MKLNNLKIMLCLILLNSCTYSQDISGKAIYTKEFIKSKSGNVNSPEDIIKNKVFDAMIKTDTNLEYVLNFKKNVSLFKLKDGLDKDSNSTKSYSLAAKLSGGAGNYYTNIKNDKIVNQLNNFGETYLINSKVSSINWDLSKETKKIGKFSCYKATTKTKRNGRKGVYYTTITAWYCPDLPAQHGPVGYAGLPGLILELNHNNKVIYKLKEINLTKTDVKISEHKKGKTISLTEYDEIVIEMINKRLNRN